MVNQKTAVLLIGFGGPERPQEVGPFIQSVAGGRGIPEERLKAVAAHYEAVGGVSPYNASALKQKRALEIWLGGRGEPRPVYLALRHSRPGFEETISALKKERVERIIVFVLSSFRSAASFDRYLEALGPLADGMELVVTEKFHAHPLFIESQVRRMEETLAKIPATQMTGTFFLFTAHSIPVQMSEEGGYANQFSHSAQLVADKMKINNWGLVYQSRGAIHRAHAEGAVNRVPTWVPWLEPDVNGVIRQIDSSRFQNVVVVPIGFLLENVEILYDLDIEAGKTAERCGLRYWRAGTVGDEPKFIEMMGTLVIASAAKQSHKIASSSLRDSSQ